MKVPLLSVPDRTASTAAAPLSTWIVRVAALKSMPFWKVTVWVASAAPRIKLLPSGTKLAVAPGDGVRSAIAAEIDMAVRAIGGKAAASGPLDLGGTRAETTGEVPVAEPDHPAVEAQRAGASAGADAAGERIGAVQPQHTAAHGRGAGVGVSAGKGPACCCRP